MHHSFDWIFFAIVGVPFVLALVALFRPDLVEAVIRDEPIRMGGARRARKEG